MAVSRLKDIPSVTQVLNDACAREAVSAFGHIQATAAIREALEEAREAVRSGAHAPDAAQIAARAASHLAAGGRSTERPVLNLTGTVLHTNLGRALLAETAIEAAVEAMRNAVSLEFDLATGKRGDRDDHLRSLLRDLTGAEDATIVNNNAAAVLLALN